MTPEQHSTSSSGWGDTTNNEVADVIGIVASDVGSLGYVVQDGVAGIIVQPGDAPALADACRRVLGDPGLADRLGRAGRERAVGEFAWPLLVQRYIDLFRSL